MTISISRGSRKCSFWINDAHIPPFRDFETEGQILSFVLRRLFITNRDSARIWCQGSSSQDPHFANLEMLARALQGAGLVVRKFFEGPRAHRRITSYDRSYEVRRAKTQDISHNNDKLFFVRDEESFLGAMIGVYIVASVERRDSFAVAIDPQFRIRCLRWLPKFAASLGYNAASCQVDKALTVRYDRFKEKSFPYQLEDYMREQEWRLATYFLKKVRPQGELCEYCGRKGPYLYNEYGVAWTPVYEVPESPSLIVAIDGFNDDDLRGAAEALKGAILCSDDRSGMILVPFSSWEYKSSKILGYPKSFLEAHRLKFRVLKSIPRPRPARGICFGSNSDSEPGESSVPLRLTCLGGGQEIGANSYLLEIKDRRILLDCGSELSESESNPLGLPHFDKIKSLDLAIVSHAHADHIMSILSLNRLFPNTQIICSLETAELFRTIVPHHTGDFFVKMRERELGVPPLLQGGWSKDFDDMLTPLKFDEKTPIPGLPGCFLTLIRAGHVLGAAMALIEVGETRILYTGDFCLRDQFTVKGCSIDSLPEADILITESTYASARTKMVTNLEAETEEIAHACQATVDKKGIVLLPCFGLGKSQEVVCAISRAVKTGQLTGLSMNNVFVRGLGLAFMTEYVDCVEDNDLKNALILAHSISGGAGGERFSPEDEAFIGPRAEIATHGMMLPGTLSNRIAAKIVGRTDSSIVITGYQPLNSLGDELLYLPDEPGQRVSHDWAVNWESRSLKASVHRVGMSSHATNDELRKLIHEIAPSVLVVVHGDPSSVASLAEWAFKEGGTKCVYGPVNLESLDLGCAVVGEDAVEEWKSCHVKHASFSSLFPPPEDKIAAPEISENAGMWLECRADPDMQVSDDGSYYTVRLDPSRRSAEMIFKARWPFRWKDVVSFVTFQELDNKREVLCSLSDVQPDVASRFGFPISLRPGFYHVEAELKGTKIKLLIEVRLDLESVADEWNFSMEGQIDESIRMNPVHLSEIGDVLAERDGAPVTSVSIDLIKRASCLDIKITRTQRDSGLIDLRFIFRNGYPDSYAELQLDSGARNDEVLFSSDVAVPGKPFVIQLADEDGRSSIDNFAIESLAPETFHVGGSPDNRSLTILPLSVSSEANKREFELAMDVRRGSGYFVHPRKRVSVLPVFIAVDKQRELPPDSNQSLTYRLDPEIRRLFGVPSELRSVIGDNEPSLTFTGDEVLVRLRTPDAPGLTPLRITGIWQGEGSTQRYSLFEQTLVIGYGEEIDEDESDLTYSSCNQPLLVMKSAIPYSVSRMDYIAKRLERYDPHLDLSGDRRRLRILLPALQEAHFPSDEHLLRLDYLCQGATVLDKDRVKLEVLKYGNRGNADESLIAGRPIKVRSVGRMLPLIDENASTFVSLVRVRPLLEWIDMATHDNQTLETPSLPPGEYALTVTHHGKAAVANEFVVESAKSNRLETARIRTSYHSKFEDGEGVRATAQFCRDYGGALPSLIALAAEGGGRILAGSTLWLEGVFNKMLTQMLSNERVLFVITPGNIVPPYISKPLFNTGSRWIALSYPCPDSSSPEDIRDFIRRIARSSRGRRRSVAQIRSIPSAIDGKWKPLMSIACPRCNEYMHVDFKKETAVTECQCGFHSDGVGYSLSDLVKNKPTTVVVQSKLLNYLVSEAKSGSVRDAFSSVLGDVLSCTVCGTEFPFASLEEIRDVDKKIQSNPQGYRGVLRGRWWTLSGETGTIIPSRKIEFLLKNVCPVCYSNAKASDQVTMSVVDSRKRLLVTIAGLESLEQKTTDPFDAHVESCPEHLFPGNSDQIDPCQKIGRLLEIASSLYG